MSASFRRVGAAEASSQAIGILVPPGKRTTMIVRPRALAWDLLPIRRVEEEGHEASFLELSRDEATRQARDLYRGLESLAEGGMAVVEVVRAGETGYCIHARLSQITLLACRRIPGQSYHPAVFAMLEEARQAAAGIAAILQPPDGAQPEVYFNTQKFSP